MQEINFGLYTLYWPQVSVITFGYVAWKSIPSDTNLTVLSSRWESNEKASCSIILMKMSTVQDRKFYQIACAPFWKRVYSLGSKFFPFRVDSFSGEDWCAGNQTGSQKLSLVKHGRKFLPRENALYLSRNVRKRTFGQMRPEKIQISLRICAVWLESSLGAFWTAKDANFPLADNDDSDQTARMLTLH